MCKWVHELRSVTALIGLFLNGEAEHISEFLESFWSPPHRLAEIGNDFESNEIWWTIDPLVRLDLARKRKWCVSECFVNTYRDFVRAKLKDMLKYVEHCKERIHGFKMDSGQRSRAKLRTCQDSAAIPAFDESRTETHLRHVTICCDAPRHLPM